MMTISFTFDDGLKAHATIVVPMLKKYGWTGAFNVCTDFLDTHPATLTDAKLSTLLLSEHPDARMTWEDARQLLADGHEVYPHSCSHENLEERWNAGDYELVKHEIHDAIAAYREHLGLLPQFFCCPYLACTPEVRKLIRAENVEMFNNWRPGFGGEEAAETVVKTLCKLYYEGRCHIDLMFHGIVAREGGYEPFTDENEFERILKCVSVLEKRGLLRVVPYRTAHHGPSRLNVFLERYVFLECWVSRFNVFLERWKRALNKFRRIGFRTVFKDKVPSDEWFYIVEGTVK